MQEQSNETILVVEDETILLKLTEVMLKQDGYSVVLARNGIEALGFIEGRPEHQIDLAVLDIVMPGMDGFELADHLHVLCPNLPILYISAYSERVELRPERARNVPYLAKPFTSATLTHK